MPEISISKNLMTVFLKIKFVNIQWEIKKKKRKKRDKKVSESSNYPKKINEIICL